MLVNSSQDIVAKYLYDAFGNVLSKSGLLADANNYRFSSKEAHLNSGLVYYLYRYYDPNLQRWPNRDPDQDRTDPNAYLFVGNQPISQWDFNGLLLVASGGIPHTSIFKHHNYLTFIITCPKCSVFSLDHIDYSGVGPALLKAGFTSQQIATVNGDFGGIVPGYPKGANCSGLPVTLRAFMRTRFSDWFWVSLWSGNVQTDSSYDDNMFPDFGSGSALAAGGVTAYVANTFVYYNCTPCGLSGTGSQ